MGNIYSGDTRIPKRGKNHPPFQKTLQLELYSTSEEMISIRAHDNPEVRYPYSHLIGRNEA